jgi:hypothetical protein
LRFHYFGIELTFLNPQVMKFTIHKLLLQAHTDHFDKIGCFEGDAGKQGNITLKDDSPEAFDMFHKYAYKGVIEKPITKIVHNTEFLLTPAEQTAKENELRIAFEKYSMKLVRLYIFAETYSMEDLMNCTMNMLQDG